MARRQAKIATSIVVAALAAASSLDVVSAIGGQKFSDFTTPTPLPPGDTLVLGFLGGRQPWDSKTEGTRKLAVRLREMDFAGVHIETVENRKRKLALRLIRDAFDRDGDGELSDTEKASVRVILYGQSFGGAAVVKLARQLHKLDIPVLLTVQIDSVGLGDYLIPPNVRRAANLHQQDGRLIRGETPIIAEDPERTEIIGEFQYSYKDRDIDLSGVPWHKKIFRVDHSRMNLDPQVWDKVESLLLAELSRKTGF